MTERMRDLLLLGHPSEILPDDLPKVEAAARAWSRSPQLSKEDRDRIAAVWLPPEPDLEPDVPPFVFPDSPPKEAPR